MEKQFEIRTYGFNELAQLYFPHTTKSSASKLFSSWIYASSTLLEELTALEWKRRSRNLTPKQVKALVGHFDPP
jgi:hypothetical protein